jgi:hypothetical protein
VDAAVGHPDELLVKADELRVVTPLAVQGAALQEHSGPDAGAVLGAELLDAAYQCGYVVFWVVCIVVHWVFCEIYGHFSPIILYFIPAPFSTQNLLQNVILLLKNLICGIVWIAKKSILLPGGERHAS